MSDKERPKVGLGIIIKNKEGRILIGKRKGSLAQFYSIPGGHLELGETFEEGAIKEIQEETGMTIKNPKVIAVTNNLRTYKQEGKHYISICFLVEEYEGEPEVRELDKCEGWSWEDPESLPQPHFDASEWAVECYLKGVFYIKDQYKK